jgi:hypothetical protein
VGVVAVAVLALGLSGCSTSKKADDFTVADKVTKVIIDTGAGTTTVVGSTDAVITVHRTQRTRRTTPKLTKTVDNGVLTLKADCPTGFMKSCAVDHRVTVPAHTAVEIHSSSGAVTVQRVQDPITVQTGSGSVQLNRPGGTVHVVTGSGDVEVDGGSDELTLQTGSGKITAERLTSPRVTGTSSSGPLDVAFEAAPDGVDLHTSSGAVTIQVPKGTYQVDTTTSSGKVQVNGLDKGNSSRVIKATTASGDITLKTT